MIDRIPNSQTSEPIRSPQSLVVDLVVKIEEEENEEKEAADVNGDEDVDASGKRCTSDF